VLAVVDAVGVGAAVAAGVCGVGAGSVLTVCCGAGCAGAVGLVSGLGGDAGAALAEPSFKQVHSPL
jgi:hypothetical protein